MSKLRRLPLAGLAAGTTLATFGLTPSAHAGADAGARHDCPHGHVALTFDDGPGDTTPQLLKALTDHRLRATMFNVGANAKARPDLVRAQAAAGMWVGNHSFTHPHLPQLPEAQSYEEIAATQWVLTRALHQPPTLFRPPYGETGDQLRTQEKELDLLEVLWTVDSRDWAGASVDDIATAVSALEPGGIILMHDWPANTVAAVPRIARVLRDKGLCTGRVAHSPTPVSGAGTTFHAMAVKP